MANAEADAQLVVIGASAGGIEALSKLVAHLPADFPAPIVVAQHLDPRRQSYLGEILQRRSALAVRNVETQQPLESGVIYVVPSNRHVEISDHQVGVTEEQGPGPRPSIDHLLRTAARVFGERLVAVILTGNSSDGAVGARAVKEAGGTVVIQNPETAAFPSMPRSLPASIVDVVANVDAIGPLLTELVTGAFVPSRPDENRALQLFLDQLRERSGIDFNSYKRPTILRRLQRRMVATGTTRLRDYTRYLQGHPEEYQRLVGTFLIKVTEFFRDSDLFTYLREQVMPTLIEEARHRGNELRFWSAGCATGEESYSLAILVAELLDDELEQFHVRIFATDVDGAAIDFARRGIYPARALEGLPRDLVERYFTPVDGDYEVGKRIRALVVFGQHDLGQRAPFPRIDLTLCRNVLIYFTTELQRRALQLFAFSLRDDGYLVLGKSETTSPLAEYFTLENPRLRVYRRHGGRALIPTARIRDTSPSTLTPPLLPPTRPARGGLGLATSSSGRPAGRQPTAAERAESLLFRLPVGVVVVDRNYDIQLINAAARHLLAVHTEAVGEDLIHLLQEVDSGSLRAAIDAAFRGEAPPAIEDVSTSDLASGETRFLRLRCSLQRGEADAAPSESVLVLVEDVTPATRERQRLDDEVARQRAAAEQAEAKLRQLAETNRRLAEANEALTTANAELRGSNEELLVANEEVQAATEEVETLNEELQATNEELETLNEELQATVEELNTTNDDLEARSVELQGLAATLEEQRQVAEAGRARLQAFLASMGDAVLVVDAAGQPILTNAVYDETFGGGQVALATPEGEPVPKEAMPQVRAARGESFSMEFTITPPGGSQRWFEANGQPIRRGENPQGGVVVIRDITDRSLRRLQEQFLAVASHELRTPLTALQAAVQMLGRRLRDQGDAAVGRYLDLALRQSQRLATQVNDLLDVARLQSGKLTLAFQSVDLVPLVADAVEVARTLDSERNVVLESAEGPLEVYGDPGRLEQVLLNLISNALSHAPESDRVIVRLRRLDDEAEIQVEDFGQGIPPALRAQIFSPFYQGDRRHSSSGLGLGLAIARDLVAAHQGMIDVASTEGEGTTFTVRLPLSGDRASSQT